MTKSKAKQEVEIKRKALEKLLESQKEIIERKKKEEAEKQEKKEDKEKSQEEEESEEPEFFEAPRQETRPQKRIPTRLEETFQIQNSPKDENLEESLAGVETPKKKEESKEFYNSFNYGFKQEEAKQKYGSPIQTGTAQIKQRDLGPLTAADVRIGNTTMTGISSEVLREINEYSPKGAEEKYNVRNMEQLDPTNLNRDRNRNPFLQNSERVEIKYE